MVVIVVGNIEHHNFFCVSMSFSQQLWEECYTDALASLYAVFYLCLLVAIIHLFAVSLMVICLMLPLWSTSSRTRFIWSEAC